MTISDLRILVDNLEEYIHIPGGIERLKKTVLHLAISGQLVPQIANEGTGEELYNQIQSEKEKLVTDGGIKNQKLLSEIKDEDKPFNIPRSWKWANLAEIVEINIGRTPSRTESKYWGDDIPWVSIADLNDGSHIVETKERISSLGLQKCFKGTAVPAGTLLYSFKLTIGKMSIIDIDAVHNEAIASLVTYSPITTDYLFKSLKIIDPLSKTKSAVMGKTLNSQSLAIIEVPLPPLGEQKRIVKKVDEIFKLIEELDIKYKVEEAERGRFVKSSLRVLTHNGDKLALDNVAKTIKTKADVAELRKAILHLALSGKLVPQITSEGTGRELYKRIQSEKTKSLSNKKKTLPEINDDEIPFAIPPSWKWVHIGEVFLIRGGKRLPAGKKLSRTPSDYVYIRVTDMSNGTVDTTDLHYVDNDSAKEISRYIITSNDLYLSIAGSIGKVGKIPLELSGANLTENASRLTPYSNDVNLDFYQSVIASSFVQDQFQDKKVQMAQPKLALFRIENSYIPLPPSAEQKRIVQKTTELLDLVTELEKHLEK